VSMFDWAKYRRTKGAIKLHLLLDHDGYLPSFAVVTEGKTSEIKVARTLRFEPGTILAIDAATTTTSGFGKLTQEEVYFVTRMKDNAVFTRCGKSCRFRKTAMWVRDQIICFPRLKREGEDPVLFRRVEIWDAEKQESLGIPFQPARLRRNHDSGHLQGSLSGGVVLQGTEADAEDQDLRGDQRQCGQDPGVDGATCDAGAQVPAIEDRRSLGRCRLWQRFCGSNCSSIATCTCGWTTLFRLHQRWPACMMTYNN